ncbi:hypothetical protein ACI65C_005107 [Semiaphis heraclei]
MSLVWNVFTKSECGYRATCDMCFKSFSNSGSNTTNLWNHLKKSHKGKYNELDKQKRGTDNCELGPSNMFDLSSNTIEKTKLHTKQTMMTSFTLTPSNKLKLDKILAYFVAVDMMPYNIVEKEGFKAYTLSICLGCQELSESHTGDNLASAIQLQLLEYNCDIDASIGAISTDYGANVLKAVENLKIPHVPCFGHSFNTAVKRIFELDEVKVSINNVRAIQNIFAYSWKAVKEMAIEQKRYGLKTIKFPSYSKTRWWSLLDLIEVVLSQELPLASFLRTYNKGVFKDRMIDEHQIEILKTVISTLSPIRKISDNLAGESYVTASAILPVVIMILKKLLEVDEQVLTEENRVCLVLKKTMLETMMTVFTNRYGNNITLKMCTALDPRFKLDRIDIEQFEHTSIDLESFKKIIKEECIRTWQYSQSKSELSLESSPKKSKSTGLSAIFDTSYDLQSTESTNMELSIGDKVENEVNGYLNLPKIDFEQSPVRWWHLSGTMFPFLKSNIF